MRGFAVVEFRVLQVPSIDTAKAAHLFFVPVQRGFFLEVRKLKNP